MNRSYFIKAMLLSGVAVTCGVPREKQNKALKSEQAAFGKRNSFSFQPGDSIKVVKIQKTEEEWKAILTADKYRILREGGTELPFVNEYWNNKEEGIYYCAACGLPLFSSEHKYKSGTGWPSFWKPIAPNVVEERVDNSLFMTRTEIVCARCESHLGHVFEDGPEPTGLRYCMNSLALDFKKQKV